MTNRLHTTIIVAILVACAIATVWASWAPFNNWNATSPDWTVAPCIKWGPNLDQTATLTPYTYTDRCVMNGEVIYPKDLKSVEDFGN